jgi:hypothetical protein
MTAQAVLAAISGLQPGTTYHFRLVAVQQGEKAVGADRTFTTPSAIPTSGTDYISLQQESSGSFN